MVSVFDLNFDVQQKSAESKTFKDRITEESVRRARAYWASSARTSLHLCDISTPDIGDSPGAPLRQGKRTPTRRSSHLRDGTRNSRQRKTTNPIERSPKAGFRNATRTSGIPARQSIPCTALLFGNFLQPCRERFGQVAFCPPSPPNEKAPRIAEQFARYPWCLFDFKKNELTYFT